MSVRYEIRAVGPRAAGNEDVPVLLKKTYDGDVVLLSYYSDPALTNDITVTDDFGPIRAAFTNGILSSQWLARQIEAKLDKLREIDPTVHDQKTALLHLIRDPQDPVRKYLTGDVLGFLRAVLDEAKEKKGSVLLALYELADKELIEVLLANRSRIRIILSNSARGTAQETDGEGDGTGAVDGGKGPKVWDAENAPARQKLVAAGVDIQHRMFNNDHIGHDKLAVYLDKNGVPRKVLTGSTNWTSNGLRAQSNNAMLITDDKVAGAYRDASDGCTRMRWRCRSLCPKPPATARAMRSARPTRRRNSSGSVSQGRGSRSGICPTPQGRPSRRFPRQARSPML